MFNTFEPLIILSAEPLALAPKLNGYIACVGTLSYPQTASKGNIRVLFTVRGSFIEKHASVQVALHSPIKARAVS